MTFSSPSASLDLKVPIFFFQNTEILLIKEDKLFVELSTTSSLTDPFCLSGTALVPFAHNNIS